MRQNLLPFIPRPRFRYRQSMIKVSAAFLREVIFLRLPRSPAARYLPFRWMIRSARRLRFNIAREGIYLTQKRRTHLLPVTKRAMFRSVAVLGPGGARCTADRIRAAPYVTHDSIFVSEIKRDSRRAALHPAHPRWITSLSALLNPRELPLGI